MSAVKTRLAIKVLSGSEILVKKNEKVKVGDELARFSDKKITLVGAKDFFEKLDAVSLVGKIVVPGEVICKMGNVFTKMLTMPIGGKIVGVDELKNIIVEEENGSERIIKSPVNGKIVNITPEKIVIEFRAEKIKAEVINEKRIWGELSEILIERSADMDDRQSEKIIISNASDENLLVKAEALDLRGIIYFGGKIWDVSQVKIPILKLEKGKAESLLKKFANKRILLDGRKGKILVVLE